MINLLSPDIKSSLLYARRNVVIRKVLFGFICGVIGIVAIILFGSMYLNREISRTSAQIEQTKTLLAEQKLEETQERVSSISDSLKLVVEVLSQQIVFSRMIRQVGAVTPEGAVLSNLTISTITGGIDLTFETADQQTGTQVLLNIQDPANELFAQADIEKISCNNVALNTIYPCSVTIRALFGDNSPYLLISKEQN